MKKCFSYLFIIALLISILPLNAHAIQVVGQDQGLYGAPSVFTSADVDCYVGDNTLVTAAPTTNNGGMIHYQWYVNSMPDNTNGALIMDATAPDYAPDTSYPGVYYYYCQVRMFNGLQYIDIYSQPIRVTVNSMSISSINLASLPIKTSYLEGEYMDAAGLTLIARMSNGSERIIDAGYQISPTQFTQQGVQNVTVSYGGYTCTFPVTVQSFEASITGIGLVSMPTKTSYKIGEILDTSGMVLRAYTQNGYKDINDGFICEPSILSRSGSQTITVIYMNKTCTFNVTVAEGAKLLEVTSTPRKLSYVPGETLDTAGLVLKLSDGYNSQIISSGFTCEPTVFTAEGTQVVKVRYNDLLATFTVKVTATSASTAKPVVTAKPSSAPADSVEDDSTVSPSHPVSPRPNRIEHDSYETRSNRSTLIVVMVLCIIALIVLGAMMVVINSGGMDALGYKLRRLFRSNRRR